MSEEEKLRMPSQLNKTQKIWHTGIWQNMHKHYSSITGGQCLKSDQEVQQLVHEWLCTQSKEFFN